MKAFVFDNSGLRALYVRLVSHSNGRQMHMATLSILLLFLSHSSVEPNFVEVSSCKLLLLGSRGSCLLIQAAM